MNSSDTADNQHSWRQRANIILAGSLLIGAYFFLTEHRAHFFGLMPFLFLPLCRVIDRSMRGHLSALNGAGSGLLSQISAPTNLAKPQG